MYEPIFLLFIFPLITSALFLVFGDIPKRRLKPFAIFFSLVPLIHMLLNREGLLGSSIDVAWIPPLSIRFHLAIDNLSLVFLYLTAVIIPISLMATRKLELFNSNFFFSLVFLLQALLTGFFTAKDLALFTIFWEAMLLPLYFIMAIWGGHDRQQAALKFLVYMIAGSSLFVAAVLGLYFTSGAAGAYTFDLDTLAKTASAAPAAKWIFAALLLAFAVKTPLFPFHAWLPDTYYQAPVSGTILLSAILSKAGIYGIARIGLGLFPTFIEASSHWLLGLSIAGVFYGAFAAWRQHDYKRLIAYSSFSHVNFVLVGLFAWNQLAQTGAILQAVNHGITIAALFLVAGWLEHRVGTTQMSGLTGLGKYMPKLCWLTLFFVLSSVALPGTNNFVGELLILLGLFQVNVWVAAFLGLTVIFSVVYMLRFMQKVYFGIPAPQELNWKDITRINFIVAAPLIFLTLWLGLYPEPALNLIQGALPEHVEQKT